MIFATFSSTRLPPTISRPVVRHVSALQVRGPWGGVTGNGNVALDGSEAVARAGDINSVDVGTIMRALRLPYVAATRVDGKLQAEWPGLDYLQGTGHC